MAVCSNTRAVNMFAALRGSRMGEDFPDAPPPPPPPQTTTEHRSSDDFPQSLGLQRWAGRRRSFGKSRAPHVSDGIEGQRALSHRARPNDPKGTARRNEQKKKTDRPIVVGSGGDWSRSSSPLSSAKDRGGRAPVSHLDPLALGLSSMSLPFLCCASPIGASRQSERAVPAKAADPAERDAAGWDAWPCSADGGVGPPPVDGRGGAGGWGWSKTARPKAPRESPRRRVAAGGGGGGGGRGPSSLADEDALLLQLARNQAAAAGMASRRSNRGPLNSALSVPRSKSAGPEVFRPDDPGADSRSPETSSPVTGGRGGATDAPTPPSWHPMACTAIAGAPSPVERWVAGDKDDENDDIDDVIIAAQSSVANWEDDAAFAAAGGPLVLPPLTRAEREEGGRILVAAPSPPMVDGGGGCGPLDPFPPGPPLGSFAGLLSEDAPHPELAGTYGHHRTNPSAALDVFYRVDSNLPLHHCPEMRRSPAPTQSGHRRSKSDGALSPRGGRCGAPEEVIPRNVW